MLSKDGIGLFSKRGRNDFFNASCSRCIGEQSRINAVSGDDSQDVWRCLSCHSERSEVESKNPEALAESNSPGSLDFARDDGAELFDQSDRERILIQLSFAGLNRCDDDQHGVRHPEGYQDWDSDQEDAENRGDRVVNQH